MIILHACYLGSRRPWLSPKTPENQGPNSPFLKWHEDCSGKSGSLRFGRSSYPHEKRRPRIEETNQRHPFGGSGVLITADAAGGIAGRPNGSEVAMKKCFLLLLLPFLLAAQPRAYSVEGHECHDRSLMIDTLIDEYGEQLVEVREVAGRGLLEFHVSPEDGTWTALLTKGNGISCVIGTGEGIDPSKTEILKVGLAI